MGPIKWSAGQEKAVSLTAQGLQDHPGLWIQAVSVRLDLLELAALKLSKTDFEVIPGAGRLSVK